MSTPDWTKIGLRVATWAAAVTVILAVAIPSAADTGQPTTPPDTATSEQETPTPRPTSEPGASAAPEAAPSVDGVTVEPSSEPADSASVSAGEPTVVDDAPELPAATPTPSRAPIEMPQQQQNAHGSGW